MKTSIKKPLWAIVALFAIFPIVGLMLSVIYRDPSMFRASLFLFLAPAILILLILIVIFVAAHLIGKWLNQRKR
jgi:hypothetical protein